MPEDIKSKKKEERKESKIKRIWKNVKEETIKAGKKALIGGLISVSLLSPSTVRGVNFHYARFPPYFASELIEKSKDENVRLGWNAIKKINEIEGRKYYTYSEVDPYYMAARIYFKHAYEKNKTPENAYLYYHASYFDAVRERTYEGTEQKELEVIKLIDERLKEQSNDIDFIDLKQIIYYNLAIMYYRAAVNFDDIRGTPSLDEKRAYDPSKKEFYKKKAREYIEKWLKFNKQIIENLDKLEFFAWREGYEDNAKREGVTLKQFSEECKEGLKKELNQHKEELKNLLKNLENN